MEIKRKKSWGCIKGGMAARKWCNWKFCKWRKMVANKDSFRLPIGPTMMMLVLYYRQHDNIWAGVFKVNSKWQTKGKHLCFFSHFKDNNALINKLRHYKWWMSCPERQLVSACFSNSFLRVSKGQEHMEAVHICHKNVWKLLTNQQAVCMDFCRQKLPSIHEKAVTSILPFLFLYPPSARFLLFVRSTFTRKSKVIQLWAMIYKLCNVIWNP